MDANHTPKPRSAALLGRALLALTPSFACGSAITPEAAAPVAPPLALTLEVRARELAPGEPIRIVVGSPEPLARIAGELFGEPLAFVPLLGPGAPFRAAAWSLVRLDASPGRERLFVRATPTAGAEQSLERELTIVARDYPTERLEVEPRYVEPPVKVTERLKRERERLDAIYRERGTSAVTGAFLRPVPGEPTSAFGLRRIYNGKPRAPHPGLDLRAATGTPVRAAGPGRVVFSADLYYSGLTVILDHGGGLFTIYAHLSELRVAEATDIEAGTIVGLSGATGRVTGPHLHWGAKIGTEPFDPRALLDDSLFD